jgi:large subunit ribosomal protein L24
MPKTHIKRGDVVTAIAGDDAASGKTGKVMRVFPEEQRAIVEGLNLVKKAMRKTQDNPKGGIHEKEAPIHLSNLKLHAAGGRGEAESKKSE